jgi:hypothetical protein
MTLETPSIWDEPEREREREGENIFENAGGSLQLGESEPRKVREGQKETLSLPPLPPLPRFGRAHRIVRTSRRTVNPGKEKKREARLTETTTRSNTFQKS